MPSNTESTETRIETDDAYLIPEINKPPIPNPQKLGLKRLFLIVQEPSALPPIPNLQKLGLKLS